MDTVGPRKSAPLLGRQVRLPIGLMKSCLAEEPAHGFRRKEPRERFPRLFF